MKMIGIVDYNGVKHCMEHASTVSSYAYEVHEGDGGQCWCGDALEAPAPKAPQAPRVKVAPCDECGGKEDVRRFLWFRPNRHDDGWASICQPCRRGAKTSIGSWHRREGYTF